MSFFAMTRDHEVLPGEGEVDDTLAGNLCRCTVYAPIVRAAQRAYDHDPRDDAFTAGEAATVKALAALQDGDTVEAGDGARRFLAPASLAALAELYATHPEATLTAGSTDVGLWVTKNFQRPETDRKSTRLNSSHQCAARMPSSA